MASANIVTITDGNFETEVIQSDKPVLVDFWAPWCGPCIQLGPVIDQIADATVGRAKVTKLDVQDYPQLAARFGINGIPALLVFKNGQVAEQLKTRGKAEIVAKLDALV